MSYEVIGVGSLELPKWGKSSAKLHFWGFAVDLSHQRRFPSVSTPDPEICGHVTRDSLCLIGFSAWNFGTRQAGQVSRESAILADT
jgi:hypothetical protein